MPARTVLRMGDPRLLQVSEPVRAFDTPELRRLIDDMIATVKAERAAGLAAIQIGIPLRVVVFGLDYSPRADGCDLPMTTLINPAITPLGNDMEQAWEGCLSLPGLRGLVPRYRRIRYTAFDIEGRPFEREVDGFHARVVQHECDHLDGILYPRRMTDLTGFGFVEELQVSGAMNSAMLPCEDADRPCSEGPDTGA